MFHVSMFQFRFPDLHHLLSTDNLTASTADEDRHCIASSVRAAMHHAGVCLLSLVQKNYIRQQLRIVVWMEGGGYFAYGLCYLVRCHSHCLRICGVFLGYWLLNINYYYQKPMVYGFLYTPNAVVELLQLRQYFCQDHGARSVGFLLLCIG